MSSSPRANCSSGGGFNLVWRKGRRGGGMLTSGQWRPVGHSGYLILSSAQASFAWPSVDVCLVVADIFYSLLRISRSLLNSFRYYNWGSVIGFHTEVVLFLTAYRVLLLELLKKLSVGKESCGGRDFIVRKTECVNISPIGPFFCRNCDDSQTYWSTLNVKLLITQEKNIFEGTIFFWIGRLPKMTNSSPQKSNVLGRDTNRLLGHSLYFHVFYSSPHFPYSLFQEHFLNGKLVTTPALVVCAVTIIWVSSHPNYWWHS